jgi:hypothetical protein
MSLEADWVSTDSWESHVATLDVVRVKYGDRELHRFIVACCRRIWHLITDPRSRAAIEVAERYHAGVAEIDEVDVAREQAWEAESFALYNNPPGICGGVNAAHAKTAVYAVYTEPPASKSERFGFAADDAAWVLVFAAEAAAHAAWLADSKLPWEMRTVDWDAEYAKERVTQLRLFKEWFGTTEARQATPDPAT